MKKECQVIMLPTNDITDIIVPTQGMGKGITHLREYYGDADLNMGDKYQHLYIISDDEIKEGDWCLQLETNTIFQSSTYLIEDSYYMDFNGNKQWTNHDPWCVKKIIATTDSSLKIRNYKFKLESGFIGSNISLLQIPQSFIIEYCKNPVDKVMVEYVSNFVPEMLESGDYPETSYKEFVKVNSDNTINISHIKTSWNREEVEKIYRDGRNKAYQETKSGFDLVDIVEESDKWIEKNLK